MMHAMHIVHAYVQTHTHTHADRKAYKEMKLKQG